MGKFMPDAMLDAMLDVIQSGDYETLLTAEPATYFNACDGSTWGASTAYSLNDVVVPTTRNSFVYVCTTGGTSDSSEPTWPTSQDGTVSDGTVTWTCHTNYQVAGISLSSGDYSVDDDSVNGRALTIAEKSPVTVHTTGTVSHTAILDTATQTLIYVTTASTLDAGSDDVEEGNALIMSELLITLRDPV